MNQVEIVQFVPVLWKISYHPKIYVLIIQLSNYGVLLGCTMERFNTAIRLCNEGPPAPKVYPRGHDERLEWVY